MKHCLEKEFKLLKKHRSRQERKAMIFNIFNALTCLHYPPTREWVFINANETFRIRPMNRAWTCFRIENRDGRIRTGNMKDIRIMFLSAGFLD